MTVGLSFIFRDNRATIDAMLISAAPFVDEIIAVDTGSTDGTRDQIQLVMEAASSRGIRCEIVHFPWINDFAAARNAGHQRLQSDWAMWLDTDYVLHDGAQLRDLAAAADANDVQALETTVAERNGTECRFLTHLVRRDVGWHWESSINEVLVPARRVRVAHTDIRIDHLRQHPEGTDKERNVATAAVAINTEGADRVHPLALIEYGFHTPRAVAWRRWYQDLFDGPAKHQTTNELGQVIHEGRVRRHLGRHVHA